MRVSHFIILGPGYADARMQTAATQIRFVGITGLPLTVFRRVLDQAPLGLVDVVSRRAFLPCWLALTRIGARRFYHIATTVSLTRRSPRRFPTFRHDARYLRLHTRPGAAERCRAQAKGVGIINASPLAMGLLTKQGPPAWHPAPADVQAACAAAAAHCAAAGVDVSQLAIQHAVRNEAMASTLVGMCTRAQVRANVACAAAAFEAGSEARAAPLLAELEQLFGRCKDATWPSGLPENN